MTAPSAPARASLRPTPALLFAAGALVYLVILYPGFMSNDSVGQLLQARDGVYSDWHPPVMAFIWSFVDRLWPGPTGMLVLQTALIWIGAYLTWRFGLGNGPPWLGALLLFAALFTPQVFGIAGAIWKDNLMWGALFVAIGSILALQRHGTRADAATVLAVAVGLVALFASTSLRVNAIFAVYPLLAWAIHVALRRGLVTSSLMAVPLAGAILLAGMVVNRSLTDIPKHPWISVALFDIAGVVANSDDAATRQSLVESIPARYRAGAQVADVAAAYTPRNWLRLLDRSGGPLSWPTSDAPTGDDAAVRMLPSAWLAAIRADPTAWLRHRWQVFRHVIGLTEARTWTFAMMQPNAFTPRYGKDYGSNPGPFWHHRVLERRLQRLSRLPVFRPWAHLLLLAAMTAWLAWRRRTDLLLLAASGLLYESALFVLAPSADYRYSHYMVFVTLLVGVFCLTPSGRASAPRHGDGRSAAAAQPFPVRGRGR
ncbi:MAG: hypothetical protein RIM84_09585 [Alphaproteobacteria bacterium]